MSKNRELKEQVVADIVEKIKGAESITVVAYSGLTVEQVTNLRKQCREKRCDDLFHCVALYPLKPDLRGVAPHYVCRSFRRARRADDARFRKRRLQSNIIPEPRLSSQSRAPCAETHKYRSSACRKRRKSIVLSLVYGFLPYLTGKAWCRQWKTLRNRRLPTRNGCSACSGRRRY